MMMFGEEREERREERRRVLKRVDASDLIYLPVIVAVMMGGVGTPTVYSPVPSGLHASSYSTRYQPGSNKQARHEMGDGDRDWA